jgi:hypothetical protein
MRIEFSRIFVVFVLTAAVALTGCSTTKMLVNEWSNPGYRAASFKRTMVGVLGGQMSIRRNFEDQFVTQLSANGVDAVPSYRYAPEDDRVDETKLKEVAKAAGADAAIIVRSVNVEEKTEVGPSYYATPVFGIFGRHLSASWYGLYGAPSVHRYNVYTSQITLYHLAKNEIVWTGTVQTTTPENVNSAISDYVETVISALKEKNLLGTKK